jgi:hypothetical protein
VATVDLLINGVSYWADTVYESCHFESQVNGVAGPCAFRVRDPDRTKTFVPGQTILLTVDGNAVWRGFVSMVNRVFVFPALNVSDFGLARFIDIVGTDINILLLKRIVSNQTTPTNVEGPLVAAHTPDSTAIATLFAGWLDLSGDGLNTTTLVENVADTTWTESGTLWEGSDTWSQAMQSIANLPAAIYYIDPDKNFVYTDVDTPSAPFNLSDQPNGTTTRGYREMEVLKDGTGLANDVMAWGMGYGSQTPVFVRDTDATSQAVHGLWQQSQISFGVYKQATIDRIAQSIIDGSPQNKRGAKNDRVAVQCVTYVPGLRPAQKVDFTSNVFGFNDVIPIRKMEIDFPAADTPKYTLTLSHEIDTPFGFFDPFLLHLPRLENCPPPLVMGPNGKCILPPIIHRGCDCGITDTFSRSGALGTSDMGLPWTGVLTNFSTNGSAGVCTLTTGGSNAGFASLNTVPGDTNFGWSDATVTAQVTVDAQAPSSVRYFALFGESQDGNEGTFVDFTTDRLFEVSTYYTYDSVTVAGVDPTLPFKIRSKAEGSTLYAKIWQASASEPTAWTLSVSITQDLMTDIGVAVNAGFPFTNNFTVVFDDLNAIGFTKCGTVQFDNFNRTVAPDSWGTATPGGQTWGIAGPGVAIRKVDGGYGKIIHSNVLSGQSTTETAWSVADFTLRGVFRTEVLGSGTGFRYSLIGLGQVGDGGTLTNGVTIAYHENAQSGPSLGIMNYGGTNTSIPFTWTAGKSYNLEWIHAGNDTVRVWEVGYARPVSPSVFIASNGFGTPDTFGIFRQGGDNVNPEEIWFDWLDFDYVTKPCYPGGPASNANISSNAWVCESFGPATTTLTLTHPFLVNSPRVWLNGLLQSQSSYTQNGIAGTITFGFTPLATDNARVCYWATA